MQRTHRAPLPRRPEYPAHVPPKIITRRGIPSRSVVVTDFSPVKDLAFARMNLSGAALELVEHVYERFKPQRGINYFVLGNSGQLRFHNLSPSANMAKGFDSDQSFMIVEVTDDQFCFQTISRASQTVDSGVIELKKMESTSAGR